MPCIAFITCYYIIACFACITHMLNSSCRQPNLNQTKKKNYIPLGTHPE